jgi:hypothetical protein
MQLTEASRLSESNWTEEAVSFKLTRLGAVKSKRGCRNGWETQQLGWAGELAICKSLELAQFFFNSFAAPSQHVDVEAQCSAPTQGDRGQRLEEDQLLGSKSEANSNWLPAAMMAVAWSRQNFGIAAAFDERLFDLAILQGLTRGHSAPPLVGGGARTSSMMIEARYSLLSTRYSLSGSQQLTAE